jgi:hypothetical protein
MDSPSWLKETPVHFEEIARHHAPPLTIYLPIINDDGDQEILPPEKYDFTTSANSGETPSLDKEYQWQHLAQDSGIYSSRDTYPRSLLWRTVSGGTLTIHSVDSFRPKTFPRNRPFAGIHFRFPVKIRPNCIGFSDYASTTILYILTEDCVLYSIPFSEHAFTGENRRPESITDTIRVHRPLFLQARFGQGKLALDLPHFMYVLPNSDKVIFAMQDGTLHQYSPLGILPFKPWLM